MIEFLKGLTQLHNFLYSALWFVVILTVLVFVHEFGHYFVARWNRVRHENRRRTSARCSTASRSASGGGGDGVTR